MKTIALFNSTGGVGTTTLAYHLAMMMADRGESVLAVDLDPQAELTRRFRTDDDLELLWPNGEHPRTIFGAVQPVIRGLGDLSTPHVEMITSRLGLVVGDPALSTFEEQLSDAWPPSCEYDAVSFHTTLAFHRAVQQAALAFEATWVVIDVGPNLSAINRAALIACDYVVIPLGPDLLSMQGLRSLGPTLRSWREDWREALHHYPDPVPNISPGTIEILGYVVMQQSIRETRHPMAYQRWINGFPVGYREFMLDQSDGTTIRTDQDPYCLAILNHYRSLMPMAMRVRKPVFSLQPADGAIGAHVEAVQNAYTDFLRLAQRIAEGCGLEIR
jgi:cellulose biosynthesis protein BcsQ